MLEREADSVADHVISMPEPQLGRVQTSATHRLGVSPNQASTGPLLGYDESAPRVGVKSENGCDLRQIAPDPGIHHELLRSPGVPLTAATRDFMESRFGADFSAVRVHDGAKAASSAQEVFAQAYTCGSHIVFGAGSYRPDTRSGKALLAHELTHVLQQGFRPDAIQLSPDPKWAQDLPAARYRASILTDRIKKHGKVSTEARAIFQRELNYFQGNARDAYLQIVATALRAVTETEMPPMNMTDAAQSNTSGQAGDVPRATDAHVADARVTAAPSPTDAEDRDHTKQHLWDKEFKQDHPDWEDIGRVYGTRDDGVMTETGVRVPLFKGDFLNRRRFYERKAAEKLAWEGFIHYAELAEAGLDAAAITISESHGTLDPIPDNELDLDAFVGWSQRAMTAREGVQLFLAFAETANAFRQAAADSMANRAAADAPTPRANRSSCEDRARIQPSWTARPPSGRGRDSAFPRSAKATS